MKHAHNVTQDQEKSTSQNFMQMPWWWAGILFIVGGEVGNLIAYGYAPAAIVTPIGSVGVVTNVLLTTFVLKEPITKRILFGAACVIVGIIIVVVYAPLTVVTITPDNIWPSVLYTWHFLAYLLWILVMILILYPTSLRYGKKYVWVYVGLCAVIASLNVVTAKIFSTFVKNTVEHGWEVGGFLGPWPYGVLIVMIVSCVIAMGYVNKAMITFGNSQVVPVYFALFTVSGVGSAAWVFYEFNCFDNQKQGVLFFVGIFIAISGVFLVSIGAKKINPQEQEQEEPEADKDTREPPLNDIEMGLECEAHRPSECVPLKDSSTSGQGPAGMCHETRIPWTPQGPEVSQADVLQGPKLSPAMLAHNSHKVRNDGAISPDQSISSLSEQETEDGSPSRPVTASGSRPGTASDSMPAWEEDKLAPIPKKKQEKGRRCVLSALRPLPPPMLSNEDWRRPDPSSRYLLPALVNSPSPLPSEDADERRGGDAERRMAFT